MQAYGPQLNKKAAKREMDSRSDCAVRTLFIWLSQIHQIFGAYSALHNIAFSPAYKIPYRFASLDSAWQTDWKLTDPLRVFLCRYGSLKNKNVKIRMQYYVEILEEFVVENNKTLSC